MEHIHNYLSSKAEINQTHLLPILQQANHILKNIFHFENKELKNDYFKLRKLLIVYIVERNEEEDKDV